MNPIKNRPYIVPLIWVTLFTLLFTFPDISPDYGPGLDPSYQWALNWLFANDYHTLTQLVYPFGPLAFLEIPCHIGINFILFLIFFVTIKCAFVILGMMASGVTTISKRHKPTTHDFTSWFVPAIILFMASYFANTGILIIFNCLFLCLIYIQEQRWWSFITAVILATMALFIKISVGINAMSIVAISVIVCLMEHRQLKNFLTQITVILAVLILISFILLHTPQNVFNWYKGNLNLVFGYGSMSLDFHNTPWIWLFLLTLPASFFVCDSIPARRACLLILIPLYAFWKHGIIREDCYHYFGMVYSFIVFWLILTLLGEQRKAHILFLGAVSILSLMLNATEMEGYERKNTRVICGVKHFAEPYLHYRKYVAKVDEYTQWRLLERQLPDTMLRLIGNSSIDIYPFEFSYAAQNKLNWQPRTSLSTAFTPKLEALSAKNFSEKNNAVQYLLWHFQDDSYGKKSASMDNRYFLNDEPEIVRNILNHYETAAVNDKLMLLSYTDTPALEEAVCDSPFQAKWNDWVDIPQLDQSIVRVKVRFAKTFLGKIRSFFYREEIYTIEYQTDEGNTYIYRYDPALATEGLWCRPFVQLPCDTNTEADAVRFRLSTSDSKYVKPEINLQFEYLKSNGQRRLFIYKNRADYNNNEE